MLSFVAVVCLYSVVQGLPTDPPLPIFDVPDPALCKTGYYQLVTEGCTDYRQCLEDKRSAYARKCMEPLYWNTELCACDYTYINGTCDPNKNKWDPIPAKVPCTANTTAGECCLNGVTYDNHTEGWGYIVVKDLTDPDELKYTIPSCDFSSQCPDGLKFSQKFCACKYPHTNCGCTEWIFYDPNPLVDINQDVQMTSGSCSADGNGSLACPGSLTNPAQIFATQKAYFGNQATFYGEIDVNFAGGIIFDNNGNAPATITIRQDGNSLFAIIEGEVFEVNLGAGGASSLRFVFALRPDRSTSFGVYNGATVIAESQFSSLISGSKCPFRLGVEPSTYYNFGYCTFGFNNTEVNSYLTSGVVPANVLSGDKLEFVPWLFP